MRNILLILTFLLALVLSPGASAQTVILKADTVTISCSSSDTFLIPIRAVDFENIGSFQFTLMWDTAKLDYAYTTPINPLLLGQGVDFDSNTTQINAGKIAFLWTKTTGATLPDSAVIFNLAFRRIGGAFASLMFAGAPVPVEVADVNGNILNTVTINGGVKPVDDVPPAITCPANVTVQGNGPTPVNGIAPQNLTDNCAPVANTGWVAAGATNTSQPNDPDASGAAFNIGSSTVTYTTTDVGGNTASCSFSVTVELSNTSDTLTFIAQGANTSCNQTVSINITTLNFDSIGSVQFSLNWLPAILQFSSVSNFNPALQLTLGDNFNTLQTAAGLLAFLWTANAPEGVTLPPGATLFTINFTVLGGGGTNSAVAFGDDPVLREAISNAGNISQEVPAFWINGTVNVVDNVPPILECPESVAVDLPTGNSTAQVNGLEPQALLDNCGGTPALTYTRSGATPGSGNGNANGAYNPGVTTVTYTATDASGNTSTCSFTVTVNAPGALTLLIDSVEVDCQQSGGQVAVNLFVENWNDIFGLQFSVEWDETVLQFDTFGNFNAGLNLTPGDFGTTQTGSGILSFFAGGPNSNWPSLADSSVIFTIYFNVLNTGSTSTISYSGFIEAINSQIVVVPVTTVPGFFSAGADNSAPQVTCPQDVTVNIVGNECNTNFTPPLPQASDACSGIDTITRVPDGNVFSAGLAIIVYTVTDSAGNSATCSMHLTVLDNTPPTFNNTCPMQVSVPAPGFSCQGQANWPPPVASDACGQANLTVTSNFTPDSLFPVGQTLVIYSVVDPSGNTGTCSFIVTIQDTAAPIIICPGNIIVSPDGSPNCGAVVSFDAPIAFDNCDTDLDITGSANPNSIFPPGNTTVTYHASDDGNNVVSCSFIITVQDDSGPVLTCPNDTVVISAPDACGANVTWATPTATDNCDASVTLTSTFQPGQFFPIGTTIVPYTAADDAGNSSQCSFSITVNETVPPIIIGCPNTILITLPPNECSTTVFWDTPAAADNCDLDTLTGDATSGSLFTAGTTVVTYTASDVSGNTATCTFNVIVIDEIAPVFNACPQDVTVNNAPACGVPVFWQIPTATDNCTPTQELLYTSSHMPGDTFSNSTTNVVYYVQDASGNYDTCGFKVVINGAQQPGWANVPANITINGCAQSVSWDEPLELGFCIIDTSYSNYQPGDTFPIGTTSVTYTWVEQTTGLETSATFTVTVGETVPPVITCPEGPIVVNVGGGIVSDPDEFLLFADTVSGCGGARLEFGFPLATDDCGIASLLQSNGPSSGGVFPLGQDTLAFTALDSSGNSSLCTIIIEIQALPDLNPTAAPRFGCLNQPVTITATAIPDAVYSWTLGQQPLSGSTNVITIGEFAAANEGLYTVVANVNGCLTSPDTVTVELATAPDAIVDAGIIVVPGDTITFNVLLNDILVPPSDFEIKSAGTLEGLVNLGGGNFGYIAPGAEGVFSFQYQVCSKSCPTLCDVALVEIRVEDNRVCELPNIFTPNGDAVNDIFEIPCLESGLYRDNSLVVFNQWGDKVFEASPYSNSPASAWHGTLNGEPGKDLPDAVYFYVFKPGPNEPVIKGFVEIFR